MLRVGFVVTPGFAVMSLAALSVFEFANLSAERKLYDVTLLSEHGGHVPAVLGAPIDTMPFCDVGFDTLIMGGNVRVVPTSSALQAFIVAAAKTTRRMSAICTGVFALADAGLLEGRRVTTHWLFTDALAAHPAEVRIEKDRLFIQDGPVWTAAGNSAGIDLALCMVEQDHGSALALAIARILVVDHQRAGGQSQHSTLLDLNPKSDRVQSALAYARNNLRAPLSVEQLAQVVGVGPRQFSRAFRAETGMSPAKAVEKLRLDAARRMIEQSRHPVETIALEAGFGDQERMRRAFLRAYNHPPQAIRRMAQAKADSALRDD